MEYQEDGVTRKRVYLRSQPRPLRSEGRLMEGLRIAVDCMIEPEKEFLVDNYRVTIRRVR